MKEKIIKFIAVGLVAILAISILLNLQAYFAKKAMEQEIRLLNTENERLTRRIEEEIRDKKKLRERNDALNSDLEKFSQENEKLRKEKEDTQKQYEATVKERDELAGKAKTAAAPGVKEIIPPSAMGDNYWAGILKLKTGLELQLEKLRLNNEQLQKEKKALELNLEDLTRQKREGEQKLADQQVVLDAMALELVKSQEALKPLKDKNAILMLQLKALNNRRDKLEKELQELRLEKPALGDRFSGRDNILKDGISDTKLEVGGANATKMAPPKKGSVELPPIVVRPKAGISSGSNTDKQMPLWEEKGKEVYSGGSILGVNKENNFVVINLGHSAGLDIGTTLQVYRGARAIATIEVIQVRESISACNIKEQTLSPQAGDTVR